MTQTRGFQRYFVVGSVVGLACVAARALLETVLGSNPSAYGLSVLLVYMVAIVASYLLQGRYTFGHQVDAMSRAPTRFMRFFVIACLGCLAATGISAALRFLTPLVVLSSQVAGAVAFAIASLTVSLMSYTLNARYVFSREEAMSSTTPGPHASPSAERVGVDG